MEGKELLRLALLILALLLVLQLVPYGWKRDNPPVVAEPKWALEEGKVLFERACADCHSNRTRWPWYSYVAPVSWLLIHDVQEGRAHFNVSEWDRPQRNAKKAAEEVREGEMPLWIYRVAHREARLTAAERAQLILALEATFGTSEEDEKKRQSPRSFEAEEEQAQPAPQRSSSAVGSE